MAKKVEIKFDKIIIFFIIIFLTVLSFEVVDYFISEKLEPYLSKIKSNYFLDILFLIILGLYFVSQIINYKTTYPNKKTTFILFLVLLYNIHLRFYSNFQLLPLELSSYFSNKIYYTDIVYIIFFLNLVNYLKFLQPIKNNIKENILLEDSAIGDFDKDLFKDSLKPLVEKLYRIIKKNDFERAFTIGINSEWGTGKTSALNLLKKELEKSDNIIIEYNPWMGFEKKVLIDDFFNVLSENIDKNGLDKDFNDYSDKLLSTENSLLKNVISNIPFITNGSPSLETLFDSINKKIKLLNKKIVIIIDDIDRLDNREIFEILKLIRNTASFTNIFFLIAYDRSYVNNSIENVNQFQEKNYLDKIINIELTLPYFNSALLKSTFKELLIKKIGREYNDKISYALNNKYIDLDDLFVFGKTNDNFTLLIGNLREVKKLVNSIVINYKSILNEINFGDMIYLEILKLKYPSIYKLLYTKKDQIFIENKGGLYLRTKKNKKDEEIKTVEEYIKEICEKEKISKLNQQKAISLLYNLFEYYGGTRSLIDKNYTGDPDELLSVNHANKFERYFANIIFQNNISETDFNKLILIEDDMERKTIISQWISDGKTEDLKYRLENLKNFDTKQKFENTLKCIFIFAQSKSKEDDNYVIGFDVKKLRDKMEINGFPEDTQLKFYDNPEEYNNFVKDLLNLSIPPYQLERDLLVSAINGAYDPKFGIEFPLTKGEMRDRLRNLFFQHINEEQPLNWNFWGLYHATNHLHTDENYKSILCSFITKKSNQKEFALAFTEQIPFEKLVVIRKEFIIKIFDTIENFEEYLSQMDNSETIEEFRDLYTKIKNNNWLGVKYNFKYIQFKYQ